MTPTDTRETKERILDSAEKLFARDGIPATSLRAITADAGVNLAAVHYHFGSKDALVEALFTRRLEPLNLERLSLLDSVEASSAASSPEKILEAFVGPPLRLLQNGKGGGATFMRLMGRTMAEPSQQVQEIFVRQFREIAGRFTAALKRALPGLPPEELFWRMHFSIGAMAHTMSDTFRLRLISGGLCDTGDVDATIDRLVTFLSAGMQAPHAGGRS